jgi:hypothetical protein
MQHLADGTRTVSFYGLDGSEDTEMNPIPHCQSTGGLEMSLFASHHTSTDCIHR